MPSLLDQLAEIVYDARTAEVTVVGVRYHHATHLGDAVPDVGVWRSHSSAMAPAVYSRAQRRALVDAACYKPALGLRLSINEGHNERGAAA